MIANHAEENSQKFETIEHTLLQTLNVVSEYGVEGATTKRISKKTGMSTGILHHHFGTKENLIYEAYAYFVEDIRLKTLKVSKSEVDAFEKLIQYVLIHFSKDHSSPARAKIWLSFWSQSLSDDRVQRLLHVYHHRMISNFAHQFQIIYGDSAWASQAAKTYFANFQGFWVSSVVTQMYPTAQSTQQDIRRALTEIIHKNPLVTKPTTGDTQ